MDGYIDKYMSIYICIYIYVYIYYIYIYDRPMHLLALVDHAPECGARPHGVSLRHWMRQRLEHARALARRKQHARAVFADGREHSHHGLEVSNVKDGKLIVDKKRGDSISDGER